MFAFMLLSIGELLEGLWLFVLALEGFVYMLAHILAIGALLAVFHFTCGS